MTPSPREDEDEEVAHDLDLHQLILAGAQQESEPVKSAEEVIKEIDDIMQVEFSRCLWPRPCALKCYSGPRFRVGFELFPEFCDNALVSTVWAYKLKASRYEFGVGLNFYAKID